MTNGMLPPGRGVALFDAREVKVGKKLGSGGFCRVYECQALRTSEDTLDQYDVELSTGQLAQRVVVAESSRNTLTKEPAYAVKFLRPDLSSRSPKLARVARQDIENETRILCQLDHPNIISIKGTSLSSISSSESKDSRKPHFLIMDRLDETLKDRIHKWKEESKRLNSGLASMLGLRRLKKKHFLVERLYVATEIASALEYLHGNRMIYRDLKDGNIGFEANTGRTKLFDFGLSRSLPKDTNSCSDTYRMSGNCGTFRFMPPEVALKLPYNELADVYSYVHLLWRMLTLERPYEGYSKEMHRERVVLGGERPLIDRRWPKGIQNIIERGWSPVISERPSMAQVLVVLRETIAHLTNDPFILEQSQRSLKSCDSMDTTVCSSVVSEGVLERLVG